MDNLDSTAAPENQNKPVNRSVPTQLSLTWPDEVRGVPNAVLRGALFSISKEREIYKKRQRIAAVDGYEIRLKGERFNQHDLDLWEMALHLGRRRPGTDYVEFRASELLQALDRSDGGADYENLKEDFARLGSTWVEITVTSTGDTFAGTLIDNIVRHEGTQTYAVFFDEKLLKLFNAGYSHVDWTQRRKLKKNALAKWLHGFYATHAAPVGYKVATIRTLCGSTTERLTDFRKALRVALQRVKEVGGITSFEIHAETDVVTVKRKGSLSQRRHLAKKQEKKNTQEFESNAQFDFEDVPAG